MASRESSRIRFMGKEFLTSGLNVTDNPLIVRPEEMVEAKNILVGSTLARKKRGGLEYFCTDDSDANSSYPLNPKNNSGVSGGPILGLYEFWRYDSIDGAPKSTLMVRQGTKIWGIDGRTGLATDLTGSITSLQSTGSITFQTFEGRVYWVSTNPDEGYYYWDGQAATATEILNVKASFLGPVTGVTGLVAIEAVIGGAAGNSVIITGNGLDNLGTLISLWNVANPTNTVTLISTNWSNIPASGQVMDLSGGLQKIPPDGTPSVIVSHNGRMWGFGVPGFPYRIYASEFYNAEIWATSEFGATGTAAEATSLDLDPFGDPLGIVGAASFQKRLYVFMKRAIFEINGYNINDFTVDTVSNRIGAISHKSIVVIENDIIYASERGVLKLSSTDKAIQTDFAFLTRPISNIWNERLNRSLEEYYSAEYDERENLYLLACVSAGSSQGDTILAYNVKNDLWIGPWENHKPRCLASYVVDGISRVIVGREDGIIALTGSATRSDFGSPFNAKFRTGILFPNGEMDVEHVFKSVTILASTNGTGTLTLNAYIDASLVLTETLNIESGQDLLGSSFILGQSLLGGGKFIPATYRIGEKGYGLQLEVIYDTTDDVEVYGFMVESVAADHRISGGA